MPLIIVGDQSLVCQLTGLFINLINNKRPLY